MRQAAHVVLVSASRFYAPLFVLFGFSLLSSWSVNSGVGFVAGLVLALLLALHVLVFGAEALRTAFPPFLARATVSGGALLAVLGTALPGWAGSSKGIEGGLFLVTVGASALVLIALAGRAPTLRDEDW
jgi:multisubunit Na+/H+ antiporter MnhB subunit